MAVVFVCVRQAMRNTLGLGEVEGVFSFRLRRVHGELDFFVAAEGMGRSGYV